MSVGAPIWTITEGLELSQLGVLKSAQKCNKHLQVHPSAFQAIQPINSAVLMQIGRLKLAWDPTASSLLAQLESCDLIKIWLRYQHLGSQDGPFCAFWALFFKLSYTQILKSIRLYLCNNLSKVGHIIYHQKATDEENAMVHIVMPYRVCIICNKGNKLNTSVSEAVDVI